MIYTCINDMYDLSRKGKRIDFNKFSVMVLEEERLSDMKSFLRETPVALIEAAKIDGAGEIQIFFRIVMPLAKPALATVGLFIAFMYWNDWYLSMLYVDSANLSSLQYYMYRLMNNITFLSQSMVSANVDLTQMPGETTRMALCVLAAGPMLIVFPFFQKYFVRGISVGAVKG